MTGTESVGVGSAAPDFAGVDTEGRSVRLSDYWRTGPAVVVFLRHLGCTFCRQHVLELTKVYPQIRGASADLVCVAMGSEKVGKAFRILFDVPFHMLMTGDEDTSAYQAYGLERGRLRQLMGLNVISKASAAIGMLGSRFLGKVTGDGMQMPGTFVIDQSGTIRLAYRSKHAADNPPSRLLLDELVHLQEGGASTDENRSAASPAAAG